MLLFSRYLNNLLPCTYIFAVEVSSTVINWLKSSSIPTDEDLLALFSKYKVFEPKQLIDLPAVVDEMCTTLNPVKRKRLRSGVEELRPGVYFLCLCI